MRLGIVGLPNVGKSTLFNAITKAGAESANYPFCTIEPNVGVVDVYKRQCEDFVIPSILGMFFNAPIILYLIIFKDVNILGVTIANVIGNILRVVVQIPSLYRQGYNIKFRFKINDNDIKRMFILDVYKRQSFICNYRLSISKF